MTDLNDLIARVESGSGADRELDAEVWLALNYFDWKKRKDWKKTNGWASPDRPSSLVSFYTDDGLGGSSHAPDYTASIDAALTLLPEGIEGLPLSFKIEHLYLGHGIWRAAASIWDGLGAVCSSDTASTAPTPARALLAAILRERAGR